MDLVKLEKYQGFAADLAAAGRLLISSVFGIPVSTTTPDRPSWGGSHQAAFRHQHVRGEGHGAHLILTFPGCGLIGFLMAKLFMMIF